MCHLVIAPCSCVANMSCSLIPSYKGGYHGRLIFISAFQGFYHYLPSPPCSFLSSSFCPSFHPSFHSFLPFPSFRYFEILYKKCKNVKDIYMWFKASIPTIHIKEQTTTSAIFNFVPLICMCPPSSPSRNNHCLEFCVAYFLAFQTSAMYVCIFVNNVLHSGVPILNFMQIEKHMYHEYICTMKHIL